MEKKENQRVLITKKILKDTLLRLLQEKDLEKINVSELCREAQINRTTFYKHYASPHDVLEDIELGLIREFRPESVQLDSANGAKKYLEQICRYLYQHADLVKILIRSNTDADFANLLNEFNRGLWNLKEQVREINHLDADSIRLISAFLGSGCYHLLRQWLIEDVSKSPEEVAALIFLLISKNRLE